MRHNGLIPERDTVWFFHGFGDSGWAYREVFQTTLAAHYNVYVIDFPGFGASPAQAAYSTIPEQAKLLEKIIREEVGPGARVVLVAHSIGALIATQVAQNLAEQMLFYFNVEGNLTEADSYFSSQPQQYGTAQAFAQAFAQMVLQKAPAEERYRRYYASLRWADPDTMRSWSFSSLPWVQDDRCGYDFKALTCPKLYIWGDKDTPKPSQEFLAVQQIPNRVYPEVGHWHMLENTSVFYEDLYCILNDL